MAPVAQNRLDHLGDGMGPRLLEAVWLVELPVLLRSGEHPYYARTVVGEPANFLLAGYRTAAVPDPLRRRLSWSFGPKAPRGKEANWLATVPGRGYFAILRLYGPTEAALNRSWKPGDIEKVK